MTIAEGRAYACARQHTSRKLNIGCGYCSICGFGFFFFNSNLITFLSSSQNANNGGGLCRAKHRSSVSDPDPGSARCFQKVMLIFTVMHFPGPWEPTADLAGILHESGCLHSPAKCIPSPGFAGNEPCINITNSSGYLNAKSHQTSGRAGERSGAGLLRAGRVYHVSLINAV